MDAFRSPAPPRIVAAFRTYTWGPVERELAERFFASCPGWRHVILADVGRGLEIDGGYEVLGHTSDTSEIGLPDYPAGSSLWHNVDYGLYVLRHRLPEFDYYVTSESDLAVNGSIVPLLDHVVAGGIDFVAHEIRMSTPDWYWHENGSGAYDAPGRSLLFFMVASGRALDGLAAARRHDWDRLRSGALAVWPFCETFVPSVLAQLGMKMDGLDAFFDTSVLRFRPRLPIDDPRANRPGSLAHSVIDTESFIEAMLKEAPLRDWVGESDLIGAAWKQANMASFVSRVAAAMEQAGDHTGLHLLRLEMKRAGLAVELDEDLAFCKPALSSSTCAFSRSPDPQVDASHATALHTAEDFAFHTAEEQDPWWMVDLTEEFVIERLEIVNREATQWRDRFRSFRVESSRDGTTWFVRFVKLDHLPVSGDLDAPHIVDFPDCFVARFVRIAVIGRGMLHLRRVRVRGRAIAERKQRGSAP